MDCAGFNERNTGGIQDQVLIGKGASYNKY
jgi:hypothetical protein